MTEHTIQLWMAEFHQKDYRSCWLLLDESERARSGQFKIEQVRQQYVITKGILKQLLARYMDVQPETIKFEWSEYGKPYVVGEGERDGVVFNISHSGNKLAIVIGFRQELGVDIEQWKQRIHFPDLVKRYFAVDEIEYWDALPEHVRQKAFYDLWAKKESFVKAVGRGISLGLDQCVISNHQPVCFVRVPEIYGQTSEWKLIDLEMPEGYSGALTVKNSQIKLQAKVWG